MPSSDISTGKKTAAWILAIVAGLAASYACFMVWGVVGVLTHVIAMCSDAPEWWSMTYMWLTLLVLIPGYYSGRGSYRWFVERERYKLRSEDRRTEPNQ
ncbi:MAG: hypothetical protein HYV95_12695 [Opitutae bacterium]|nr:hypothetical protein [Opitutae bacterium]